MAKKKALKKLHSTDVPDILSPSDIDCCLLFLNDLETLLAKLEETPIQSPHDCPFRILREIRTIVDAAVTADWDQARTCPALNRDWIWRGKLAQRAEIATVAAARKAHSFAAEAGFSTPGDRQIIDDVETAILESVDRISHFESPRAAEEEERIEKGTTSIISMRSLAEHIRHARAKRKTGPQVGTSRAKHKERVEQLLANHEPWKGVVEIMNKEFPRPSKPWTVGKVRGLIRER